MDSHVNVLTLHQLLQTSDARGSSYEWSIHLWQQPRACTHSDTDNSSLLSDDSSPLNASGSEVEHTALLHCTPHAHSSPLARGSPQRVALYKQKTHPEAGMHVVHPSCTCTLRAAAAAQRRVRRVTVVVRRRAQQQQQQMMLHSEDRAFVSLRSHLMRVSWVCFLVGAVGTHSQSSVPAPV